ncbi:cysteine--tRNA ligase [Sphingobium sp. AR-3-1]|uniref:Cysteine--tRNA ligase n=1 Tax=Sphingobium psychrophilum TaxID=2728834 RepID=A0A7X9WTS5_9SPHN|nr:cysteine--tRNA ligase [Sphingobium psychrophilum]NML09750.1 cysteine--tRNA ligase [Sphingobium psychrophilum]
MSEDQHIPAPLRLFNSLTRMIEPFAPIEDHHARVYSCGPTVYNYAHIGNLRAYVFTDTLRRTLLWKGLAVTHIINITDVGHLTSDADAGDDKMEAAARASAKSIWDIAAHYTQAFKQNIADLNILSPSEWTVATDYVPQMIEFAEKIAPTHCYEIATGLYFDVSSVPFYMKEADSGEFIAAFNARVSGGDWTKVNEAAEHAHERAQLASRIGAVEGKRRPQDFAIWRKSPPGEQRQMEWDSPWGKGAPGWHLECSVMSQARLGQPFDIHTGGIDHREIHHPNEIAQNQAFHNCCGDPDAAAADFTGARWWMHNNFLVDRQGKMSKSKGGFTTLFSLIDAGVHPIAYRLLCLGAHYRSELEFSADNLAAALTRLKRLVMGVEGLKARAEGVTWQSPRLDYLRANLHPKLVPLLEQFDAAIADDLMTPRALPMLEEAIGIKKVPVDEKLCLIAAFDQALGLNLLTLSRADLRVQPKDAQITPEEIEAELERRTVARAEKDFALSDEIRDALIARGVEVMDGDPLRWDWRLTLG